MRFNRQYILGVAVGLLVLCLLNAAGIIDTLAGSRFHAGELDPILAPATLGLFAGAFLLSLVPSRVFLEQVPFLILGAVLCLIGLFLGWGGGALVKLFRDFVYLWLLCVFAAIMSKWDTSGEIDIKALANCLLVGGLVCLPTLGFAVRGLDESGRFSGFMLSAPLFGNSASMYILIAYLVGVRPIRLAGAITVAIILILASGTRTALILLLALAAYHFTQSIRLRRAGVAMAIGLLVLLSIGSVAVAVRMSGSGSAQIRALSLKDVQYGSIATRLYWYRTVWSGLRESYFVGGYGPGASEATLGYLPHFDFLRYWFDYSIVYVLGFLALVYRVIVTPNVYCESRWFCMTTVLISLGVVGLMSAHNIFQSTGGTLMMAIFLFSVRRMLVTVQIEMAPLGSRPADVPAK